MRVAVLLHIGSLLSLDELLRDINNIRLAGIPFDLYVNLVIGKVPIEQTTRIILLAYPHAIIQASENRGMDIGGFLQLLPVVLTATTSYDYVLKLHTKTSSWWRRALIQPICGSPGQIKLCMRTFQTQPRVGMIGSSRYLFREELGRQPNCYYIQHLTTLLNIPYTEYQFIGGTMFWIRTSVLRSIFEGRDIPVLRQQLNTPDSFDPYWYILNYRDRGVATIEDARRHWETYGKAIGRVGNCLGARERRGVRCIPDGMLEHAYERLFGLMVKSEGLVVAGF